MNRRNPPIFRLILVLLAPLVAGSVVADASAAGEPAERVRRDVARLLAELDSDQFQLRQRAAEELRRMTEQPELSEVLADEFQRILVSAGTSFEVRERLDSLSRGLPKKGRAAPQEVSTAEIDRLIGQLEDDDFSVRLGARKRLEWLVDNPKMVCPILLRLKERMDPARLTVDARRWLDPIYRKSRESWLTSDPAVWRLPAVSDSMIDQWCDEASGSVSSARGPGGHLVQQRAVGELRDLLARDEYVAKVKTALEARLSRPGLTPQATQNVRDLLDLTRPAMVAECWARMMVNAKARLYGTQHLTVGVPSLGPGAERPSHFDRIDDRTAHCVSGQNLLPGDYPVGVAIPHPKQAGYFFHLVNLTTPRRQMVYQLQSQLPQAKRLATLSRRTFEKMVDRKQPLSAKELSMLKQLDPRELSLFAGRFFLAVEDSPMPADDGEQTLGLPVPPPADGRPEPSEQNVRTSRHAAICQLLASEGTWEAIPDLTRAIELQRFRSPTDTAPYRWPWIAALAIAGRESWAGIDAWLAAAVQREDSLVEGRDIAPEVGATAAALLLARHQQALDPFGLKTAEDSALSEVGLAGYRFSQPDGRERIARWWTDHQEKRDGP